MKPKETNEPGEGVFLTGTTISDGGSWFTSLAKQLREYQEARKNPVPPVQITAERDMSALDKLVEQPSAYSSLISQVKGLIDDTLHPHQTETTAARVEVEEIWSKEKAGLPRLVSVGAHIFIVVLAL